MLSQFLATALLALAHAQSRLDNVNAVVAWAKENGLQMSANAEFQNDPTTDHRGATGKGSVGLFAKKRIRQGDIVLFVPHNIVMQNNTFFQCDPRTISLWNVSKFDPGSDKYQFLRPDTSDMAVALLALKQNRTQCTDTFSLWLKTLPEKGDITLLENLGRDDIAKLTGHTQFTTFEKPAKWLRKTYEIAKEGLIKRRGEVKDSMFGMSKKQDKRNLRKIMPDLTFDEFEWAQQVAMTRSWGDSSSPGFVNWLIAPVLDYLNWREGATLQPEEIVEKVQDADGNEVEVKSYLLQADREYHPGDQIYMNYNMSMNTNLQTVLHYGIADPDRDTNEKVSFKFTIKADDKLKRKKAKLAHKRKIDFTPTFEVEHGKVPLEMLAFARFVVANREEVDDTFVATGRNRSDIISRSNEKRAVDFLRAQMKERFDEYETTLEEDQKIIASPDITQKEFMIRSLLISEKKILSELWMRLGAMEEVTSWFVGRLEKGIYKIAKHRDDIENADDELLEIDDGEDEDEEDGGEDGAEKPESGKADKVDPALKEKVAAEMEDPDMQDEIGDLRDSFNEQEKNLQAAKKKTEL